jgi:hypothetical protein
LTRYANRTNLERVARQPNPRAPAWSATLAALLLGTSVGCGSASADNGGGSGGTGGTGANGGTGGTGGTSGTQGLGGSGGSGGSGGTGGTGLPAPPAAGFDITLTDPDNTDADAGVRSCNVGEDGSLSYAIGMPAPGETVPDGTDGVEVGCIVALAADGTSMDVSAAVGGPDTTSGAAITFSVESTMIQSRDRTPAFISFSSPTTGQLSTVQECYLGPFATLKTGAMLADFDCKLLGSPDDATVGCKAHGTLGVEYCATSD